VVFDRHSDAETIPVSEDTELHGPMVTLVVTCYNQAQYVRRTLENVSRQTYGNTELIIIDDCSSDDSEQVIFEWLSTYKGNARFLKNARNLGLSASLNRVLGEARGKYFAAIAADDFWAPEKTSEQVQLLERTSETVAFAFSDASLMDENDNLLQCHFSEMFYNSEFNRMVCGGGESSFPDGGLEVSLLPMLLCGNFIAPMTCMCRVASLRDVGGWDTRLLIEDWDMWIRLSVVGGAVYVMKRYACYRIHAKSTSRSRAAEMRESQLMIMWKCARAGLLDGEIHIGEKRAAFRDYAMHLFRRGRGEARGVAREYAGAFPSFASLTFCIICHVGMSWGGMMVLLRLLRRFPFVGNKVPRLE